MIQCYFASNRYIYLIQSGVFYSVLVYHVHTEVKFSLFNLHFQSVGETCKHNKIGAVNQCIYVMVTVTYFPVILHFHEKTFTRHTIFSFTNVPMTGILHITVLWPIISAIF